MIYILLYLFIGVLVVFGSIVFKYMPKPRSKDTWAFIFAVFFWPMFIYFIYDDELQERKNNKL